MDEEKKWAGMVLERKEAVRKGLEFSAKQSGLYPLVHRATEGI